MLLFFVLMLITFHSYKISIVFYCTIFSIGMYIETSIIVVCKNTHNNYNMTNMINNI